MGEVVTTQLQPRPLGARMLRWPAIGLLAGTLAWGALEVGLAPLTFANEAIVAAGEMPPPSVSMRLARLVWRQDVGNSTIALALVGAVFTLIFRVFAGPPGIRSWLRAALTGFGLGAATGFLGAAAFLTRDVGDQELAFASMIQSLTWAGFGVAGALSVPSGGLGSVKAGFLGGAAWGLVYPAAASAVSPWHHVERLIPASAPERGAWLLVGCVVVGLSLAVAGRSGSSGASTT